MKYKDSFIKYYIINPILDIYEGFLQNVLNYWYCIDCKKYHSRRVIKYEKYNCAKEYRAWEGSTCNETNN